MNTDLPVQGHRLGWIRVATSLAVRGVPPDRDAISTWMRDEGAHGESLSTSARGAPARMAVALGFLDDGLNPTDRGRALDLAAERYAPAASLFSHHIAIRWLLWHATATTEPAWWRAALSAWAPETKQFDWLLAAARDLDQRGAAGLMATVVRGADKDARVRGGLSVRLGNPWLRQVDELGWAEVMPRLSEWAHDSPDAWSEADVWAAFCVAENLQDIPPADLADLRATLADLPPNLRGLNGREAAEATVRLWGTTRGLGGGVPRCWYGEPWDALIEEAQGIGVRRKAGATTQDPNLAWADETLQADVAEPAAAAEAVVPALPAELPPLAAPRPVEARDRRARAVLRALAWWCRGPSAGDLLTTGHDSWSTFRWTLGAWLRTSERKRWEKRTSSFQIFPPANCKVDWLRRAAEAFAKSVPHAMHGVFLQETGSSKGASFEMRREACARLPEGIATPQSVERWLDDGANAGPVWADVEPALIHWVASCVERGLWTADDLRSALQRAEDGTAVEVLALLATFSQPRAMNRYLVDGKLSTSGDLPDLLPNGLFFQECVPPFDVVRFSVEVEATSPAVAAECAVQQAAGRLVQLAPALRILFPSQPDAIAEIIGGADGEDERYEPVPLHPVEPPVEEAGYDVWWRDRRWFGRRSLPDPNWPTEIERREFESSRRQLTPVDRLFGLWVTLESTFEDGENGRSVIERVALSAIPAVFRALRADAIEAAELMGEPHPGAHAAWQDWAAYAPQTGCEWADARLNRLRSALQKASLLNTAKIAVGHAFWLLSVLFAVRNRRAHEAWQPEPSDGIMFDRLEIALRRLLVSLLDVRAGQAEWSVAGRLLQLLNGEPPALLEELGV